MVSEQKDNLDGFVYISWIRGWWNHRVSISLPVEPLQQITENSDEDPYSSYLIQGSVQCYFASQHHHLVFLSVIVVALDFLNILLVAEEMASFCLSSYHK